MRLVGGAWLLDAINVYYISVINFHSSDSSRSILSSRTFTRIHIFLPDEVKLYSLLISYFHLQLTLQIPPVNIYRMWNVSTASLDVPSLLV
jgi:hypothetical protein